MNFLQFIGIKKMENEKNFTEISGVKLYKINNVMKLRLNDLIFNIYDSSVWRIMEVEMIAEGRYALYIMQFNGIDTIEKTIQFDDDFLERISDHYLKLEYAEKE